MINIFDCLSTENYLHEILSYALNVEQLSINTYENGICTANILIAKQEHQIEIICPEETDIQFGYKFTQSALSELQKIGIINLISDNFARLKIAHFISIQRSPIIYQDPMLKILLPDEKYRMAILYGLIRENKQFRQIHFHPIT